MKILFTGYIKNLSLGAGVLRKMLQQEKAAKDIGYNFDLKIFTSGEIHNHNKNTFIYIKRNNFSFDWHKKYLESVNSIASENSYDCVIIRQPGSSPFYKGIFRNKKYLLISEHHTLEIPEYKRTKKYHFLLSEYLFSKQSFKYIDGIIGVTPEITKYELKRSNLLIPSISIPNGIDVEETRFTHRKPFDGKELHLLFVAGNNQPWHGLDRLLLGLKNYNKLKVVLHIIGNIEPNYIKKYITSYKNIELYGIKTSSELTEIISNINLAVSTLALFRNKMNEACPLKSREYFARGIPFIYSYNDPDIKKNFPFIKKFTPEDTPINIDEIVRFTERLTQFDSTEISNKMRNFAIENLDWKIKMKKYFNFLNLIKNYY